eukprot:5830698-Amphidinium_carterae.1
MHRVVVLLHIYIFLKASDIRSDALAISHPVSVHLAHLESQREQGKWTTLAALVQANRVFTLMTFSKMVLKVSIKTRNLAMSMPERACNQIGATHMSTRSLNMSTTTIENGTTVS